MFKKKNTKITAKTNFKLDISGKPALSVTSLERSEKAYIHPFQLPFIKPKLLVKIGDDVKSGSPLFHDKKQTELQFLSPVSGSIENVIFGPRRRLDSIVIKVDKEQRYLEFNTNADAKDFLINSGLWGAFRAFPFKNIPKATDNPHQILISMDNLDSFHVDSSVLFDRYSAEFFRGLELIKKIAPVKIIALKSNNSVINRLSDEELIIVEDQYPLTDPGVVLYKTKTSTKENNSWTIQPHHIVELGHLLMTGKLKQDRLITIGGPASTYAAHFLVSCGDSVESILSKAEQTQEGVRVIAGGVLTGTKIGLDMALGYDHSSLTLISSEYNPEILSFLKPGSEQISYSKTFLSSLFKPKSFIPNTMMNGGKRDCVSCSFCSEVCPFDFDPRMMLRELKGDDIEEAMKQGLLDHTNTGLLSFVCPSKIEIDEIFENAKNELYNELNR